MVILTKTDMHVLKAMIEYYEEESDYNIVAFSSKHSVSQSAITKASQKFGFKGYKEFQALCRYKNASHGFSSFLSCVRLRQVLATEVLTQDELINEMTKILKESYNKGPLPLAEVLCVNLAYVVFFANLVACMDSEEKNKEVINRLIAENSMLQMFLGK